MLAQHTAANEGVKQYSEFQHWSGNEFYSHFNEAWNKNAQMALVNDPSLEHLHRLLGLQPGKQWAKWSTPTNAPVNFAPFMGKILWEEVNKWLNGVPLNPRVHIVWDRPGDPSDPNNRQPLQSLLRIVQRKYIPNAAPPIVILEPDGTKARAVPSGASSTQLCTVVLAIG